jgi:thymidylate synthase
MDENTFAYRLDQLEKDVESLKTSNAGTKEWQATYGEKITNIEKNVDKLTKLIEGISEKPQKRWDSMIGAGIAAVITIVINLIFKGGLK